MRKEFKKILAKELRFLAIETRERLALTQKEMGERLQMSESSYSDIERGRYTCSVLTASLLLNMQEDPRRFLHGVEGKFNEYYAKEMQLTC